MNAKEVVFKHLKKTVRKREFWFTVVLYPTIVAGYYYLKNNHALYTLVNKSGIWYFVIAFILFVYIICYVAFEIIEKKLLHKVQGDKLKMKQEQNWRS